jgi:hypothetical protein
MPALLRWIVTQISERLPPHLSERPHSNSDEAPWNDCHGRDPAVPRLAAELRQTTDDVRVLQSQLVVDQHRQFRTPIWSAPLRVDSFKLLF